MSQRGILQSRNAMAPWPWSGKPREEPTPDISDGEVPALEMRDEKEAVERPDEINLNAKAGLQKAEAAALIWQKKTVICLLAW